MIEWLSRADPTRPFLRFEGSVWSYGEALREVSTRLVDEPRLVRPTLDPDSVLNLLAALFGGGATVLPPGTESAAPADATLVVFTSGSSGEPKGVRLTEANLAAAASASAQHLGHGPDDDWLLAMPLHHVGGISILVRQAFSGGSVTMLPRFDPTRMAEAMLGEVTMVSVVPTMLARLVGLAPFSGLRAVVVGGGPIPEGLLEQAAAVGLPVLPSYGMTETFGQAATLRPGSPLERKAHLLPGMEARVDTSGRISLKGPQVSPGYLGEADRVDPWFATNDIGEIDREGAVRVLGRADTVIVSGGENISPEAVETVIRQHPAVVDAVVFGVPDEEWGDRVEALYVGDADPADLRRHVAARLRDFMVPKRFIRVAAIPRTPIGKPDRVAAARFGVGGS